ncbi:glycerophosphodiester phosphodiesterase family protein [Mastigocoleus sp. MO_188.B34]|uniref:glycerophosphodiester phosphodiesterase family protein n=1 Tax=Mastigocoleus sp. MO_188.B34 TaxID=3036635 RepID=UPI00260201F2|nr:glycerophosphodiester phosphodiesterase family protein [Mastigocoleus sp. MO_188.B34]MDJ0692845.1 glycerophosphodiester phosphodiesterase family protein [Mastigocoleus sp. MO_188.B34]
MTKARLKGFASLPADTFADGPQSGADNGNGEPISANGRTGPFDGQPVQGFSGVQFAPGVDCSYWFLSDNGFGAQTNSADYLLRLYQVNPNFVREEIVGTEITGQENGDGSIEVEGFIQLSDPGGLIPFDITNQDSSERLLTGADFDIESFVIDKNGDIWIGDEFGPYILHFDSTGKLLEAPISTPNINNVGTKNLENNNLKTLNGQDPLVIAHRGASGDFPEHTLEAYRAAIAAGADFIEPDLVTTKDGVLIVRHEPMLDDTTNVAEVFGEDRKSTKMLDGEEVTAYFAEDFTLAEIKQLRAVQSRDFRDPAFDGLFEIPTFKEVIELVQEVEAQTGKQVGIYPETKHPTFFDEQGLSLEEPLVATLQETGFTDPNRIFIQSFEFANLIDLQNNLLPAAALENLPLVQLYGDVEDAFINENGGGFSVPYDIVANFSKEGFDETAARAIYGDLVDIVPDFGINTTYKDLATKEVFDYIGNNYGEGIGPWKNSFVLREPLDTPVDGNGDGVAEITSQLTGEIRPYINWAHDAGMQVHPYTLRDEERFLTLNPDGTPQTPQGEVEQLINLGVDGFFTDFARTADPVRDAIAASEVRSPQNPDLKNFNSLSGEAPLVIGHRGASGDFPEHTLEAYRLAIIQGADFVEPDLVTTKDGVLIARHEPLLDDTTNVAEVFGSDRKSTKLLDGEEITGYFAEDFTLAEIKQLGAVQSRDFRSDEFDGKFEIPTFKEVIELVQEMESEYGFKVGIYPETKHPTFFDEQGLSLEEPLIATLQETGFTDPNRIFIQSFEFANLIDLQNNLLPAAGLENLPLVQLYGDVEDAFINEGGGGFSVPYDIVANFSKEGFDEAAARAIYGDLVDIVPDFGINTTYKDLATKEVFDYIGNNYSEGIGPWKNSFVLREPLDTPVDGNGDGVAEITSQLTGEVRPYINWAHDALMQVHPYTLRDEERFLTLNPDGTPQTTGEEFLQLTELGVDGFFTDFPETGRIVVDDLTQEPNLRGSRGFEGMAFSSDRTKAYPLLEGTVVGDPENSLRIYEFDLQSGEYTGLVGYYPTTDGNPIGDFTPINDHEFLVIERDGGQGDAAEFKKIFKIDISKVDENGFVEKEEIVDLLNIDDPNDLNGDGETTFKFPFVTIEDVLVVDENTILVANDNNYPFSVGRGPDIDNNEVILLELDQPLDLDPRLGQNPKKNEESQTKEPELVEGTDGTDLFVVGDNLSNEKNIVFTGAGDDEVDLTGGSENRVNTAEGDDLIFVSLKDRVFGGEGNDTFDATDGMGQNRMSGGGGDDIFFLGKEDRAFGGGGDDKFFVQSGGDNLISGGEGADQFWVVSGEIPESANTVLDFEADTDVIGILGSASLGIDASTLDVINDDVNTAIAFGDDTLAVLNGVTNFDVNTSVVFG